MDHIDIQEEKKVDRRRRSPSVKARNAEKRAAKKAVYMQRWAAANPGKVKAARNKSNAKVRAAGRWKCELCQKCFAANNALQTHLKVSKIHAGESGQII